LSAVEGLGIATQIFEPFVVPITVVILVALFWSEPRTAGIGTVFGPIMIVWFVTLILLGLPRIAEMPVVLTAVNPAHAIAFLSDAGLNALGTMGAVFLSVTGAEALYADMGHSAAGRSGWRGSRSCCPRSC